MTELVQISIISALSFLLLEGLTYVCFFKPHARHNQRSMDTWRINKDISVQCDTEYGASLGEVK